MVTEDFPWPSLGAAIGRRSRTWFFERYEWSTSKNRIQQLVGDVAPSSADGIISGRYRVV